MNHRNRTKTLNADHRMRRTLESGLPLDRRALLRTAAGFAVGGTVLGRAVEQTSARGMDPYTYIKTMKATTYVGQKPGEAAVDVQPIRAAGKVWDAYIQVPIKRGQDFHYTCEFDSAWIILKAYGHDLDLEEQLAIVGQDESIEPYWEETDTGIFVYGGDIEEMYSGHYNENILARARGSAVRKVFDSLDLAVTVTPTRRKIEKALLAGQPVFFKSTVDFLDWRAATWIAPDDDEFPVVLTNDHALVVMGFDKDDVIIRDPLGPTTTNETRPWQYLVSWERYLEVIAAQGNDAFAVGPAAN